MYKVYSLQVTHIVMYLKLVFAEPLIVVNIISRNETITFEGHLEVQLKKTNLANTINVYIGYYILDGLLDIFYLYGKHCSFLRSQKLILITP